MTLEYRTRPRGQIEIRVGTGRYLFDAMNGGATFVSYEGMNSIPADGRFVRDGEMEGLDWRGGDKGGNIESSGVIYARILIWIVSNAEEEGGGQQRQQATSAIRLAPSVRPSTVVKGATLGLGGGGSSTLRSARHSLFQAVFVWVDTVLNCLASLFQISAIPCATPNKRRGFSCGICGVFEKWSMV